MSIYGTTTLNPRKIPAAPLAQAQLPGLLCAQGEPVFAEPWQASAFALTVALSRQGCFRWNEWAAALADELKANSARGEPDDGSQNYHCWLTTLERLTIEKGLSDSATLLAEKKAWAEAYQRTPHGLPVELARAVD